MFLWTLLGLSFPIKSISIISLCLDFSWTSGLSLLALLSYLLYRVIHSFKLVLCLQHNGYLMTVELMLKTPDGVLTIEFHRSWEISRHLPSHFNTQKTKPNSDLDGPGASLSPGSIHRAHCLLSFLLQSCQHPLGFLFHQEVVSSPLYGSQRQAHSILFSFNVFPTHYE